jgi:holliday junction DNA helicase RuvA
LIRLLEGTLRHRTPDYVVIGCSGVGYRVRVPVPLLSKLGSVGQPALLWIHTQVRDDAISLFGFEAHEDLELFETLISINGIGAKIALAMMSTLPTRRLVQAVRTEDMRTLTAVPGIGKRSAERIIVELRDRLDAFGGPAGGDSIPPGDQGLMADLESGLANLGFKAKDIARSVEKVLAEQPDGDLGDLLAAAIAEMTGGKR